MVASLAAFALTGCMIKDGAFAPVNGKQIDDQVLRSLESEKATFAKVAEALGGAARRESIGPGAELWTYEWVRSRTSREEFLGFGFRESTQTVQETYRLSFADGRLASHSKDGNVTQTKRCIYGVFCD